MSSQYEYETLYRTTLERLSTVRGERNESIQRAEKAERERDALASHVERAKLMVGCWRSSLGGDTDHMDEDEADAAEEAERWIRSNPAASLDAHDAALLRQLQSRLTGNHEWVNRTTVWLGKEIDAIKRGES